MHVFMEDYAKYFDEIKATSLSHATCRLVIFVSCLDIDALCASKMISSLLKSDLIPHKIIPIVGYDDLRNSYQTTIANDEEVRNVILVGCGATIDLIEELQVDEEEEQAMGVRPKNFYIMDTHRPWNLDNLFASPRVVCFLDGYTDLDKMTTLQQTYSNFVTAADELEDISDEESDKDEDGFYKDNDNNDEVITSDNEDDVKHNRFEADAVHTSEDDNDIGSINSGEKRLRRDSISSPSADGNTSKKRRLKVRTRKEEFEEYRVAIEGYYAQGSSLATSASSLVYSLVSDLVTPSINDLWLTVVAATSLDAQHPHLYRLLFPALKTEVLRLNPNANVPTSLIASASSTTTSINGSVSEETSLYIETDYPFYLLRHWTLYDSMSHSSYVSAKLRLYTDEGRRRLHKMLAKMGISLHDARERWTHMNLNVKSALPEKLGSISGAYGIEDVIRQGIVRRFGYKGTISAGDCVDALLTLMQTGNKLIKGAVGFNGEVLISEEDFHSGNKFIDGETDESRDRFWVENFWSAWDALDNVNKMIQGIQMARSLQKSIVISATAVLERRLLKNLRRFKLVVFKDGPDLEVFSNPLALTKLAVWIAEASAEVSPRSLPLVVASYYPPTDAYLVVGMGPRKLRKSLNRKKKRNKTATTGDDDINSKKPNEEEDDEDDDDDDDDTVQTNEFGRAFHQVADAIRAKVKLDAFESSIIEVEKQDLSRFLEQLSLVGIKY